MFVLNGTGLLSLQKKRTIGQRGSMFGMETNPSNSQNQQYHTHIFCSGLSGIQTFMFAMATSILSIISFPPCQICRVSDFCGVDKNRQKTATGQIKNAHQKHTHIYPSIHQSIYARHVSWQSSLLKCGNNFKSSFVLPLPSPSFS